MGALSIMSSDSQVLHMPVPYCARYYYHARKAMGRVGEVITRTWQTADKMKRQRGPLTEDGEQPTRTHAGRVAIRFILPMFYHIATCLVYGLCSTRLLWRVVSSLRELW